MSQQEEIDYNPWLYRFAIFTAAVVVFLIVAGATVTSTVSGDAVPDWPLSYGTLNPPMIGGILWEHSHRLIAGFTGILIGVLAIWLWVAEPRKKVKWLGMAALFAVIIQALLGGLRVLIVSTEGVQDAAIQLTGSTNIEATRIAITVAHAFLAQTILCAVFAIVLFTSRSWINAETTGLQPAEYKIRWLGVGLVATVFLQLVIGALVRHTNAGLIIPDLPLSFGQLIPPFGNLPNNPNAPFPITDAEFTIRVVLHFAHRVIAFIILGLVVYVFVKFRNLPKIGLLTKSLIGLTVIQVLLGALNIWTAKSVFSTVPHVAVGALVLANCVLLTLWAWRFYKADFNVANAQKTVGLREAEKVNLLNPSS